MPTLNSPTLSGDVSGTIYSINVNKIKGVSIASTAPLSNQTLVYNGTQWAPSSSLSGTVATFSTSVSAPALSGTFFGDGSRLTGVSSSDRLPLSGGTLTGGLTGTTARFTGNVGIGTAAEPTSRNGSVSRILQVVGTDNNVLNFTNTTLGRGAALEFNRTGRTNTRYAQIFAGTDASDNGSIRFLAAPAGSDALTEHVIIDSQGDLGIGTLTPNEKLTVVGNISATGAVRGVTATFTTSISAPALSGVHFGDGSRLFGVSSSDKLPLSGGTLAGNVSLLGAAIQLGQRIDGEDVLSQAGKSVSLNSAGDRVAVGAIANNVGGTRTSAGHVRVYSLSATLTGTSWTQLAQDIDGEASLDYSGWSISLNGAGDRVAIGAIYNDVGGARTDAGHVRVFSLSATSGGTAWTQLGLDIDGEAAGDLSGYSVSINSAGNRVAIGANYNDVGGTRNNAGHVRVYSWNGTAWTQLGLDLDGEAAEDGSGWSVSMNAVGDRVAVGAPGNLTGKGHTRIYSWNGSAWTQLGLDIDGEAASDSSGQSVSLNAAGDRVAIGAPANSGAALAAGHTRIYSWNGSAWTQLGLDIDGEAAEDYSGRSVSLNAAGDRVAIGASQNDGNGIDSGHVRIYYWDGVLWSKLGLDIDGEAADLQGTSVSMNAAGDRVAIGAPLNVVDGAERGSAYVYSIPPALTVYGDIRAYGKFYGDGSNLTGITGGGGTANALPLSGGTLTGGLSAPALSGVHFGDGSRLTGVSSSDKLPLSGGDVTGNLNIGGNFGVGIANPTLKVHVVGNSRLQGDVTITGNLSCIGTQTFTNTVFTTTSALSVVNFGSGAALYVGNNGIGDIASFYDIDANVEVLHVGGNNGTFPNVGVKTSFPNKTLTVNGEISASGDIWTTTNFNGARATLTSSVSAPALSGAHFGDGSRLTGIIDATRLPLSGGTMTGQLNLVTTTETKAAPSIASNALSLDLATATFFSVSVNSNVTFTFANTPASPRVYSFMLQLIGDGTVRTIAWPAAVRWGGGVPPAVTSTLNKVDTFSFLTHDGGTNWFGFIVDQNS